MPGRVPRCRHLGRGCARRRRRRARRIDGGDAELEVGLVHDGLGERVVGRGGGERSDRLRAKVTWDGGRTGGRRRGISGCRSGTSAGRSETRGRRPARARAGGGGAHRRGRRRRGNDSRDVDSNARRGRTFEDHGADVVVARVAHALRAGNPRQRRPRGSAVGFVGPRVPTAIDILGARERRHDLVRGGDGGDVLHVPRQAQGATRPATQERRHGRDAREDAVTRTARADPTTLVVVLRLFANIRPK